MGALIFVVALVVVALVLVFAGVKTVSQGTNWTIERFGRYTKTLTPGLHLIVPFVDTVGRKMNMQENVLIAGLAMASLPTIAFFLFFQRNIMAGLTSGATKG